MNQLINIAEIDSKTITSRQIAERTGKRHTHVKRDIEKMLDDLGEDAPKFGHIYFDSQNREQKQYVLDEKHALCLAAGYSAKLRMKIIELVEELSTKPKNLTYEEQVVNVLALSQAKIKALETKVEVDAPKVEFYETVTASSNVCQMAVACNVAKLPIGRNKLYRLLRRDGVMCSGGKRHNLPKQRFINQGLFTVEESKYSHPKTGEPFMSFVAHVTQKGIDWLIRNYSNPELLTPASGKGGK